MRLKYSTKQCVANSVLMYSNQSSDARGEGLLLSLLYSVKKCTMSPSFKTVFLGYA